MILVNVALVALLNATFGLASSAGPGGAITWSTPQFVSKYAYNGAFIPVLKADSNGRLIMVYNQVVSGGGAIENPYYRESVDGGTTWSEPAAIRQDGLYLTQATLEFDEQNLAHAVWRTGEEPWKILHSREDQWPNSDNQITSTVERVFNHDLAIGMDGTLHVVWAQEDNKIYYAQSEDKGNSWTGGTALSGGSNKSDHPAIAADQYGNLHVVWDELIYCLPQPCSTYEIHYTTGISESQGINWTEPSPLPSEGVEKAVQPDILTQGDDIHVVFARRDGTDSDVTQYAYYTSHGPGSDWIQPIDITHDPLTVHSNVPMYLDPALVPCDDALYVYFHGAPTEFSNEVIMGAVNTDGWTQTFSAEVDNARAIRPSVVCLGGKMHMVYEKVIFPNSNHQIYYVSGNRFAVYLPLVIR